MKSGFPVPVLCVFAALGTHAALAQRLPTPGSVDVSASNLNVTMRYIEDRLNQQGKVNFLAINTPARPAAKSQPPLKSETSVTVTDASTSVAQCALSLHSGYESHDEGGERIREESTIRLALRDVETLEVDSVLDGYQRGRETGTQWEVFPPTFILHVLLNSGTSYHDRSRSTDETGKVTETEGETRGGFWLYFREEVEARRMAEAMERAAELCAGDARLRK